VPENQTIQIPEKYKSLGAKSGFNPGDSEGLRMIVETLPGRGKTQFLMSCPNQLVLDFDGAAHEAVAHRCSYIRVTSWEQYLDVKGALLDDAKTSKRPFKRIAFDTVDRFLRLLDHGLVSELNNRRAAAKPPKPALRSILEYGESGAGYAKLTAGLIAELTELERAGYAYLLSCHMKIKDLDSGAKERRSVMPPNTMDALVGLVDIKCRMYRSSENKVINTGKFTITEVKGRKIKRPVTETRKVYKYWLGLMPTSPEDEEYEDTKRRIPSFEGIIEIPLTDGWAAFASAYAEAVEKAKQL
jgi:hypothetical protein